MKLLILSITIFFTIGSSLAQETVKGIIMDSKFKTPLPYTYIINKNTKKGTITNEDGEFQLKCSKNDTLTFTFISYEKKEIPCSYFSTNPIYFLKPITNDLQTFELFGDYDFLIDILIKAKKKLSRSKNQTSKTYFSLESNINSNMGTDIQAACDNFTWIDGNTYTTDNNTATHTLTNAAGCDSIVTLNLTINSGNTGADVQAACDNFTWIDGNTYTTDNNTATYTLTNAVGCDSVVTLDLTINAVDIATANSNDTITSNATGATFQWLDCDNAFAIISGEISQDFVATSNGNFAVEVTQNSCKDTSICVNITTVDINSIEKKIVSIYPNPTKELINVNFGNIQGSVNYTLTSIEGRIIEQKQNVTDKSISIDLSKESLGVYLLKVNKNESVSVYRIVRQ
tara:strand:+ start:177 stop:1376 length:1200 start_codon:yes stop_codon:yes gene_type:complete